jgi:hypothetical protein
MVPEAFPFRDQKLLIDFRRLIISKAFIDIAPV